MNIQELISEELVLFTSQSQQEVVLGEVAELLKQAHKTKDSYKQAVIDREAVFPTGLETEHIGIAIPHTDSQHVIESAIAIGILAEPVSFIQMATTEELVGVNVIFMLALKKAEDQLEMLQTLIELIQNEAMMMQLKNAQTATDVIQCIQHFCQA